MRFYGANDELVTVSPLDEVHPHQFVYALVDCVAVQSREIVQPVQGIARNGGRDKPRLDEHGESQGLQQGLVISERSHVFPSNTYSHSC